MDYISRWALTWLGGLDRGVLWLVTPLSAALLASGLDDLVVDLLWASSWLKDRLRPSARLFPPGERQLDSAPRRRIAILIPLWKEHRVIGEMLEHNLAAIRYDQYEIFAGVYPNDPETEAAVRKISRRFAHVHLAPVPHEGPTSKADCLNWAFQHLLIEEESRNERFDVVIVHDAEDLIHPEELRWINYYSARFDFIQTPVLPLPTPFRAFTHGLYCDDFAENHARDMTVRPRFGGFVPGAGVGTGFRRDALEKLAVASRNQIFDPESSHRRLFQRPSHVQAGMQASFRPVASQKSNERFRSDTRIFSQDMARRSAATVALGHRHRPSGLGAVRVGRYPGRTRLALAGPQRPYWQSPESGGWSYVLLRACHRHLDSRSAFGGACGRGYARASNAAIRDPDRLLGASVRIPVRSRSASSCAVWKCAELRCYHSRHRQLHSGPIAGAAATVAQN